MDVFDVEPDRTGFIAQQSSLLLAFNSPNYLFIAVIMQVLSAHNVCLIYRT